MKPLISLHTQFQQFYDRKTYELIWNGQVCVLEELLNREFDGALKRIWIEDYIESDDVYIFNVEEQNEETFVFNASELEDPLYIFKSDESLSGFIIHIPIALVFNQDYFHALVKKYKLPSINYTIKYE
ncbi:MAG: hypothetical protein J0G96_07115 [Flavobacteriia bacterium]|nr:hypothetical protein [Flavobacteriia bacterium]OJX36638.1 MAG: hypothetical protein BGO87_12625 [Flavobacteriia bacterium 40-80]